ncbi:MAG: carboxyl transferase domain-containing protein [bacterium]|nr:carboxyl transferase domain-containing protein [bacterium]
MFTKKRALDVYQALHSYQRVRASDVVPAIYTNFTPWNHIADFTPLIQTPAGHTITIDPANNLDDPKRQLLKKTCIVGIGSFGHRRVAVIAQQTPPSDQERGQYNYGLSTADDYILAITMMRFAATHNLPLHTYIDTVGGDPFTLSARKLQSWLISECIAAMITHPVPTISVILGQGGSGGALAIHPADYRLMLDGTAKTNGAFFSVIDPKGCAAILFRSESDESIMNAIEILQPTADHMLRYGIIHRVIDELPLETNDYHAKTIANIHNALHKATHELEIADIAKLQERRTENIMSVGRLTGGQSRTTRLRRFIRRRLVSARRIQETNDSYVAQIRIHTHRTHGVKGEDDVLAHIIPRVCDDDRDTQDPQVVLRGGCRKYIEDGSFEQHFFSCPHCGKPDTIDASQCIEMLFDLSDATPFNEMHSELTIEDIEGWRHLYNYGKQRKRAEERAHSKEALIIGYGKIHGLEVAAAIHHFPYMGGAFSAVCGEKFRIIAELAVQRRIPLITYTATGGMSMWNGTMSLWQMVKTILALTQLKQANIPTISILGHPTTGGSFVTAVQSSVLIGERKAEARFAGRRVVTLSSGGQDIEISATSTEFFHEQGLLHMVLERKQMKSAVYSIIRQWYQYRAKIDLS